MTDDINDVRHTSTLAKFEEAVRRSSPGSDSGMAVYSELPEAIRVHLLELETFIGDCDGQWTALQTSDENVVLDNGTIDASGAVKAFNGIVAALHSSDHAQTPAEPDEPWQDDPASDERWNAGLDFAMMQLCDFLGVDPKAVNWDAATETLDGDVQAVLGNILRAGLGEDWSPSDTSTDRPKCKLCGLEDGACICAHIPTSPQSPSEPGMQGAVQYRRKDGGYGPRWITMAMFDGTLAAESYCSRQRKDDKWPFEYRAIELPAVADTSTHQSAPPANGSLPSGESDPSVTIDLGGADTCSLSSPVWPEGCRDGNSCARHKACMYVKCRHNGRSIAGEVEAAIADTRPLHNSESK